MIRLCCLCLAAVCVPMPGIAAARPAQASPSGPRVTFTKTLKGSTPEYKSLTIAADGEGSYDSRALADAPAPRPIRISSATTEKIFSLAQALNNFQSIDLDSHRKVANMGLKTFTYQNGAETHSAEFNYTENRTAQQLAELFEDISSVEEGIKELEYDMKYDHLSLPQTLRQIQEGMNDRAFVEATLMIPTLEKISSDSRFLHLAQVRAQEIVQRIEQGK